MQHVEKLKNYRANCVEEMNRCCRDLAQLAPEMFSACALLALALVILVLNAHHGLKPIPVLLLLIAVYLVFSSVLGAMWLLLQRRQIMRRLKASTSGRVFLCFGTIFGQYVLFEDELCRNPPNLLNE